MFFVVVGVLSSVKIFCWRIVRFIILVGTGPLIKTSPPTLIISGKLRRMVRGRPVALTLSTIVLSLIA